MANAQHWSERLKPVCGGCGEANRWAASMPDPQTAWAECNEPAWMLWFADRISGMREGGRHRRVILTTCYCVRLLLPFIAPTKNGPARQAIKLTETWARWKFGVTLAMIREAADAARVASFRTYGAAAGVVKASAYAAYAVDDTYTYGGRFATYKAAAAVDLVSDLNPRCLRIIRRMLPDVPQWFDEYKP